MSTAIYSHPDGHAVAVGGGLLTVFRPFGRPVSVPLDAEQLGALAAALLECADEAKQAPGRAAEAISHRLLTLGCAPPDSWFPEGSAQ